MQALLFQQIDSLQAQIHYQQGGRAGSVTTITHQPPASFSQLHHQQKNLFSGTALTSCQPQDSIHQGTNKNLA